LFAGYVGLGGWGWRNLDSALFINAFHSRVHVVAEVSVSSRSRLGATALLFVAGAIVSSLAAQAADWTAREAELVGLHQLCDKGDRKACVRFGMLLGEAKERHADWRRSHADWWWWEH